MQRVNNAIYIIHSLNHLLIYHFKAYAHILTLSIILINLSGHKNAILSESEF